jgi:hypothetical protein
MLRGGLVFPKLSPHVGGALCAATSACPVSSSPRQNVRPGEEEEIQTWMYMIDRIGKDRVDVFQLILCIMSIHVINSDFPKPPRDGFPYWNPM